MDAGTKHCEFEREVAEILARIAAPVWCREEAKRGHKAYQRSRTWPAAGLRPSGHDLWTRDAGRLLGSNPGVNGAPPACRPLWALRDSKFGRTAFSRFYDDLYIVP